MQYVALDDPENSVNQEMTKKPIIFHYSINWQMPSVILRDQPLITGVFFE
jgi:hypothetical protein